MYARAAIIGRVTREHNERRSRILIPAPTTKPTAAKLLSYVPMSKQCIPCTKGPCGALLVAIILLSLGAVMCNFAFHAETYSTIKISSNNQTATIKDHSLYSGLKSLTYIGPTFMGIGAFLVIVCCVLLFDIREKRLKLAAKEQAEQQQSMSKEYTNKTIWSRQASSKKKGSRMAEVTDLIASGKDIETMSGPSNPLLLSVNNHHYQHTPTNDESLTISNNAHGAPPLEQINNIATISHPNSPHILIESRNNSIIEESDEWVPVIKLTASIYERGPIIRYEPQDGGVNPGYQHSDYELKNIAQNPTNAAGTEKTSFLNHTHTNGVDLKNSTRPYCSNVEMYELPNQKETYL